MQLKTETLKIYKVKNNPDNPRTFKVWDIENAVKSLLTFPEMLIGLRPIVIKDNIVLGGNLRLKALHKILDLSLDDIAVLLAKHSKDKSTQRIEYLIEFWSKFQDTKEMTFVNADSLTDIQIDEFIIKDNVSLGNWDVDMLSSWDLKELKDWGLTDWDLGLKNYDNDNDTNGPNNENTDGISEESKELDSKYTQNIKSPIYEPKNEKPEINKLYDINKTNELIQEIENSSCDKEIKQFLIIAAQRHIVFNYELIADYYAHTDKETQNLMENSALVIIDFKKAIELGYVQLNEEIKQQYLADYNNE